MDMWEVGRDNARFAGGTVKTQPGYVIENAESPGEFFSLAMGRSFGQPSGAYIPDRDKALRFARRVDAAAFAGVYLSAVQINIVEVAS